MTSGQRATAGLEQELQAYIDSLHQVGAYAAVGPVKPPADVEEFVRETGVFERFPDLRVVFVEPGLGWVAWWLDIVDDLVARQGYEFPALRDLPSAYFHRNMFLTFVDEPHALRLAQETLGIDNVMWSSDYPHPVSSWPRSQEIVTEMFGDADPEDRDRIVRANAARVWRL